MNDGIISQTPTAYGVNDASPSYFDVAGKWLVETLGTYATSERDQWFAKEGISNIKPSDTVEKDNTAPGDLTGRFKETLSNPIVLGGLAVAALLIVIAVVKK